MKKLIMSVLAMAALASCEKATENVLPEPTPENNLVPIELRAKVLGMEAVTKAEITAFDGSQKVGIYALEEDKTNSTYPWAASPYYHAIDVTINGTAFTFSTPIYYPLNGNKVKLHAYCPVDGSTEDASGLKETPITAVKVSYKLDGQTDILYGEVTSGSLNDATPTTGEMAFEHKLAKVEFKVITGTGFDADKYNVTQITINNTKRDVTMSLEDGTLDFSAGINESITNSLTTPVTIAATTSNAFGTMMIQPAVKYELKVTIAEISTPANTKTFTTDIDGPTAGTAQTVTLTFDKTAISPSAKVTPWGTDPNNGTKDEHLSK